MFTRVLVGITVTCFIFTACAGGMGSRHVRHAAKRMEKGAPEQTEYFNEAEAKAAQAEGEMFTGSLWSSSYYSHIYDNMYRASRVGDTIMIVIDEKSDAESTGDTKTDRKTDHSNSIANLGGLMAKLQTIISGLSPTSLLTGKTSSKFQGKGTTNRTGKLFAQISATVVKILKNGNLVVRGEKHIKVNKEDQLLIVEGIVRPYDILPNNTVMSYSLADARITYSGFGVVAERQSPGWLVRALDYIWPF